jgi:hypothetical protein
MTSGRKTEVAQANNVLRRLLRTPKTRAGLIAAVRNKHISRNFVYGWLTEQTRTGKVAVLKSGEQVLYQGATYVVEERPAAAEFPAWLEPRAVPPSSTRRVFLDGREVDPKNPQREEQEE